MCKDKGGKQGEKGRELLTDIVCISCFLIYLFIYFNNCWGGRGELSKVSLERNCSKEGEHPEMPGALLL